MQGAKSEVDRGTLTAFVLMVFGIGGNVIAIKYIARAGDLDPFWAAASRFLLATLIFTIVARRARAALPRGRALLGAALYGALSIGAFFSFTYWGLQQAPAGLASVFLATGPLLTFLLALAHGQERFRWDSMIGAAVVVGGTALVFRAGLDEGTPVAPLLAILAASLCAAEGAIVVKGFPPVHPAARNAIAMGVGSIILLALMPLFDESYAIPTAGSTWVAQTYLVSFGTVGVFGLYLFLLGRWTASAVSYEFVLAPVVGIVLAAWLFDEQITGAFAIGSILVMIGVYLGALRPARKTRALR
ncbi:MAG TPA: DMT family transporter [Actinomycetota bacterium]